MEKIVAEEIKINKRKENENRWAKWTTKLGSTTKWVAQKLDEKHVRTWFTTAWTPITIVEVGEHHNFQSGFWAYPHKYMGVNLGCTT
jgi:hypothetical protein